MTRELIESIQRAVAEDADDVTKERGVEACRSLLAALAAKPGQSLVGAPPGLAALTPLAAVTQALGNTPPSTILDALIARLRAKLPTDGQAHNNAPRSLSIPFVPFPPGIGPRK